jgi:hypothetical protein
MNAKAAPLPDRRCAHPPSGPVRINTCWQNRIDRLDRRRVGIDALFSHNTRDHAHLDLLILLDESFARGNAAVRFSLSDERRLDPKIAPDFRPSEELRQVAAAITPRELAN